MPPTVKLFDQPIKTLQKYLRETDGGIRIEKLQIKVGGYSLNYPQIRITFPLPFLNFVAT